MVFQVIAEFQGKATRYKQHKELTNLDRFYSKPVFETRRRLGLSEERFLNGCCSLKLFSKNGRKNHFQV